MNLHVAAGIHCGLSHQARTSLAETSLSPCAPAHPRITPERYAAPRIPTLLPMPICPFLLCIRCTRRVSLAPAPSVSLRPLSVQLRPASAPSMAEPQAIPSRIRSPFAHRSARITAQLRPASAPSIAATPDLRAPASMEAVSAQNLPTTPHVRAVHGSRP
jgi:hypothetical protein